MNENAIILEIVNKVVDSYQPEKVLLFGSYATGNETSDSDVDLIIVKDTKTPRHKRGREVRKYLFGTLIPIDLKVYTPDEFEKEKDLQYSFINSVINECITLYERKN
jgi:predicted nucleotidyltransferase